MPTLSSSIVKNRVASMHDVEEALARQVLYGGDLATNLLELAAVREAELTQLLADSHALTPAPVGDLPRVDEAVLRLVPGELAQRHAFFPIREHDGVLEIAVAEPLPPEVEEDLCFALGVRIEQRAAPVVRIRQAIAREYDLPLDRRTLRLIAKLEGVPISPSSMPVRCASTCAHDAAATGERPSDRLPPETELAARHARDACRRLRRHRCQAATVRRLATTRDDRRTAPPTPEPETAPVLAPALAPPAESQQPPTQIERNDARPALVTAIPLDASVTAVRTAALAENDLMQPLRATTCCARSSISCRIFEYSALFAVQSDIAEDATQPDRAQAPSDQPHRRAARAAGALSLAKKKAAGGYTVWKTKAWTRAWPRPGRPTGKQVLLCPVIVRGRCVLILTATMANGRRLVGGGRRHLVRSAGRRGART
jgi:hypothetical protein